MHPPSLRFHLRERTASLHAAVDDAVGVFEDLAAYRRYLVGMHAFRARCEAAIAAGARTADTEAWGFRPLLPLIEADMADLGIAVPKASPSAPPTATRAETAGRLYVLEGSALGARVLAVRARALGLDDTHGARHLASQSHGGRDFRRFAAWLDTADLDAEAVVAAALATFAEAARAFAATADSRPADAVA